MSNARGRENSKLIARNVAVGSERVLRHKHLCWQLGKGEKDQLQQGCAEEERGRGAPANNR